MIMVQALRKEGIQEGMKRKIGMHARRYLKWGKQAAMKIANSLWERYGETICEGINRSNGD